MTLYPRSFVLVCLSLLIAASDCRTSAKHDFHDVAETFFEHNQAQHVNTDSILFTKLTELYPESHITIVPSYSANLFSFAAAGLAASTEVTSTNTPLAYAWREYIPPARRLDSGNGTLVNDIKFGIYLYRWQNTELLVYYVDGRDGVDAYPTTRNQYVISDNKDLVDELIVEAGNYGNSLHDEIWVFDQGYWRKDAVLWRGVQQSSWDNVILDEEMKTSIIDDTGRFFNNREQYANLGVPWKRGIIFYGPPGNGKTISIKATMHTLYNRSEPVPTLYVKTLSGYGEWALSAVFEKARQEAPCFLVFEDLDSLVTPDIRSYFLNQVDGLQENDGIFMVGSTNHIETLDPGIAKRPSRFDRKYLFPNPSVEQRVKYCEYWRGKLSKNKDIAFPHVLTEAIANITEGFSFAYIQEAFVATLLEIAGKEDKAKMLDTVREVGKEDGLDKYELWRIIKKQITTLRKELEDEEAGAEVIAMESYSSTVGSRQKALTVKEDWKWV